MASKVKAKKDGDDEDGDNVSRTGRQRKKSAKVLEMEAEAEELAQVLRARVDPGTPRYRPTNLNKMPRVKKTPIKFEVKVPVLKELPECDDGIPEPESQMETSPVLPSSKSGRVRKKSAKLIEMVEVEGMDRKIFRTSHLPKSMRNPVVPSTPPSSKKSKVQVVATSPVRSPGSVPGSPPCTSPSAIKQLLSGPVKKTSVPTSPLPDPILSTLGATLSPPAKPSGNEITIKTEPVTLTDTLLPTAAAALATPGTVSREVAVKFLVDCPDVVAPKPVKKNRKKQAMPTPSLPATGKPLGGAIGKALGSGMAKAPKVSPVKASPGGSPVNALGTPVNVIGSPVKVLGSPVKVPGSPVKVLGSPVKALGGMVQLVATPGKLPGGMQKVAIPKLKNLLSPTKKVPPGGALTMVDQPLLSKMMGEVGQIPVGQAPMVQAPVGQMPQIPMGMSIGPPPPSSAEAKSMKKKARKEAAAALKGHVEIPMMVPVKKVKREDFPVTQRHFGLTMGMMTVPPSAMSLNKDDDHEYDPMGDEEDDQLMIDTTKALKRPKKSPKKGPKSPKLAKVEVQMAPTIVESVPQVVTEEVVGMMDDVIDDVMPQEEEEDPEEDDDEEDMDDDDVDIEVPTHYANTHVMANKVQTSTEKKASKEKKKKKGKKDDPDKQKKKRGPTAYMLWCNAHRQKLVKDTPGIDFATISKRLGEMWSGQTEKEKMAWKRKAKKLAAKGSTVISTGKGVSQMVHGGSGATLLNRPAQSKAAKAGGVLAPTASRPAAAQQRPGHDSDQAQSPLKSNGCSALDVAAHLKLLGESLSIIGARLQEHHGQIAVQGTLPVLLDSLLCALGPLSCLTTSVSQLDGAPITTHAKTLDNIAYIMPGIG